MKWHRLLLLSNIALELKTKTKCCVVILQHTDVCETPLLNCCKMQKKTV